MQSRIQKVRAKLEQNFGCVLITEKDNRFYHTGFNSSAGWLLIFEHDSIFITDTRYAEMAKKTIKHCEFVLMEAEYSAQIANIIKSRNVKKCYIEDSMTLREAKKLRKALGNIELVDDDTLTNALRDNRMIKDENEIALIEKAQDITDTAFEGLMKEIKVGMTETEVRVMLERLMVDNGADDLAFSTIAVSGENSSLPHGVPGKRRIKEGDFLTLDFGAKYQGYCTDMTRTIAFGEISEKQREVYDIVLSAQLAGVAALRPGVTGFDVDKVSRDIIEATPYAKLFGHGLGHSLGIFIHEEPRLSSKCHVTMEPGMVMTVEPGIYIEGEFGVRIEDTCVVTWEGSRPLSRITKDLIVINA